jgi:hypothetical protein
MDWGSHVEPCEGMVISTSERVIWDSACSISSSAPSNVSRSSLASTCIDATLSGVAIGLWKHIQSGLFEWWWHHRIHRVAFGVASEVGSVAHPVHGKVCTLAGPPLQSPFHCADKSQLVIQEKGLKPSISFGINAFLSERSSRNLKRVPNSLNV